MIHEKKKKKLINLKLLLMTLSNQQLQYYWSPWDKDSYNNHYTKTW